MTDPSIQTEEQANLNIVRQKLDAAYQTLERRVHQYAKDVQAQKTYLWENRSDMDHAEKVSTRQAAMQIMQSGEVVADTLHKIEKLRQSPWFGRIDFKRDGHDSSERQIYVGIHTFTDTTTGENIIFDWRAPVSSMFYDFETGPARYESPSGTVTGKLTLKRQFKIQNGRLMFVLESGLHIMDEVLQDELSRTSDDRMKTIVATIQRDQNAIIRNEDAQELIIQGVAGSGKTSIALHRIAFLLYRHRDTLSARDILIISPNKVFGDFISNVLPELGETQIAEMGMEQLADELLARKVKFQTFFEQTSILTETSDSALKQRITAKSTVDFVRTLDKYTAHVEATRFVATDVFVGNYAVPAWVVEQAFNKRSDLPLAKRVKWAAEVVEHEIWINYRYEISTPERAELKKAIGAMYRKSTVRSLYKDMFTWMGRPDLFKMAPKNSLEYADVFPLIYLKIALEGLKSPFMHVKHLLVDEMQDYTPLQYAVLQKLFPCQKTILGDAHQAVNPYSASNAVTIGQVFKHAERVHLHRSYRSSYEITRFAGSLSPNVRIDAIKRHGEPPVVISCISTEEELQTILSRLIQFEQGSHHTLGIICKTQKQAQKIFSVLSKTNPTLHLLSTGSTAFQQGITVCAAQLSKGLEFDYVIIPYVTAENYATEMDRGLLYVAATRALHHLTVTHTGPASGFLPRTDVQ
ncbi:MAG: AAA family ATPase [Deltaproteobacteria bacterium]|nr:AAA family ATPase [Deltaproteobacteria bacterium]